MTCVYSMFITAYCLAYEQKNVSHSYPEGVWTASAQRRPSVSDQRLLLSLRLIATRIELRAEAAGLAWR